jgi:hypothetical protein
MKLRLSCKAFKPAMFRADGLAESLISTPIIFPSLRSITPSTSRPLEDISLEHGQIFTIPWLICQKLIWNSWRLDIFSPIP